MHRARSSYLAGRHCRELGEQDVSRLDRVQHVGGGAAVVSLAFGQLQADRAAFRIDKGVDLCGQAAA